MVGRKRVEGKKKMKREERKGGKCEDKKRLMKMNKDKNR